MKKIVSIALFGDASRKDGSGQNYHRYLSTFVLAHHNLFPARGGWELHVHVDDATYGSDYGRALCKMQDRELITLTRMGDAALTKAMLWRMTPVFGANADYVFSRDIDCVPMPRDRAVCDVFITSNCAAHTVHDSPSHVGVMGGLCGFQTASFKNTAKIYSLRDLYDFAKKTEIEWAQHGTDQTVLNRLIDRRDGPTLLEHRYNGWHAGPNAKEPRVRGEYHCRSWSTPVPNEGKSSLSTELQAYADRLANHLGAAGYDIENARAFWEEHGDTEITNLVRECE